MLSITAEVTCGLKYFQLVHKTEFRMLFSLGTEEVYFRSLASLNWESGVKKVIECRDAIDSMLDLFVSVPQELNYDL